ncbi:hypothetical protein [Psychrobacter sp. JB193]|uniref:hypothetical protein n=1 Tax=Psychrobacter sp. JB193 TaxID=2024406 RepID=UPI000BAAA9D1|nr:hypothetical protein [Psychrobacter sp. JB193]PAT63944.1 hypothetical protein CIK80_02200 [Psychrobacter sp. JB193]
MIEKVINLHFTGLQYQAVVRLGNRDIEVSHDPIRGESMDDIQKQMIVNAKEKALREHCMPTNNR